MSQKKAMSIPPNYNNDKHPIRQSVPHVPPKCSVGVAVLWTTRNLPPDSFRPFFQVKWGEMLGPERFCVGCLVIDVKKTSTIRLMSFGKKG